jgi:hypothetical protein
MRKEDLMAIRTFPRARLACLVLSASTLAASAHAAQIVVWEHPDFRGAAAEFDGSVRSLEALGWNDRISSLRIDSGQWEVCREIDYRGCQVLSGEELANLDLRWNDAISSLRPVSGLAAAEESPTVVARRLYRAILGRDADAEGLRNAAAEIQRGRMESLIHAMLSSAEYRNLRAQRSAAERLDQMYRALLGRPADTVARRSYLAALERGDEVEVIADLLASEEYGSRDLEDDDRDGLGEEDRVVQASGSGLVIWGANGRYESITGAKVALGRDGGARIDFTGTTAQTLNGTWTRESEKVARLSFPEIGGRRTSAEGWVMLDDDELARIELTSGTPGARSSAVMAFIADDYTPPADETACQQEVRAQLEEDRGAPLAMLFLTPDRSRVATGRDRLDGEAVVLAAPGSLIYRCDVDTRRDTVLDATSRRR